MGESVVGARGKPKLVLGAKVPMGEGPTSLWMPGDTDRNLACQGLAEAWGWKQLASSEPAPLTPPQHCWQAVSKIKTRQKAILGRHRERGGGGGWRRPCCPQPLILWLP